MGGRNKITRHHLAKTSTVFTSMALLVGIYFGLYFCLHESGTIASKFPMFSERFERPLDLFFFPAEKLRLANERRKMVDEWQGRLGEWISYYPKNSKVKLDVMFMKGRYYLSNIEGVVDFETEMVPLSLGFDGALGFLDDIAVELIPFEEDLLLQVSGEKQHFLTKH